MNVQGFRASAVKCDPRPTAKLDLALVCSARPCTAAGIFTSNRVKAAPVQYDIDVLAAGDPVRAVVINSGNANAMTGEQGRKDARSMARITAEALRCEPGQVLVLSTGVIGVPLPMDSLVNGIPKVAIAPDNWDAAAQAIMTTDTEPKRAAMTTPAGYSIAGIAKGAGMIAPDMATMLAVIVTDAALPQEALQSALGQAAAVSFNRIVVDGDMSTNDTVLLLANGASEVAVEPGDAGFLAALTEVCEELAQAIVRDGEGATKFVTLHVAGAPSDQAAEAVARTIATSPLVKTAFHGADPNWGRIMAAAGRAGVDFQPEAARLWLQADDARVGLLGEEDAPDLDAARAMMAADSFEVHLDLGAGAGSWWLWTCDLSPAYATFNSHYS